jgi:hypothetical protein
MTVTEALLIILLIIIIGFIIYYYFRGSSGKVQITRPMESRVDEYLDRRFESIIDEWALVNRAKVKKFKADKEGALAADEARMSSLKTFEQEMGTTLAQMEERIENLEKQIPGK